MLKLCVSRDPTWMKLYVAVLLFANLLNTIFLAIWLYNAMISNFGDIDSLMTADWLFATGAVMTGIIVSYVQVFFAWRVKVLTGSVLLSLLAGIPSVLGFVASLVSSFEVKRFPRVVEFGNFKDWIVLWLVSETTSDLIITSVLVTYLCVLPAMIPPQLGCGANRFASTDMVITNNTIQRRNKQGFRGSDEVIDRIIRLTVQTGLVTSVVAVIDVVLFLVFPNSATHLVFNIPLNKIYSIMLMSSLNSRQGWAYGTTSKQSGTGSSGTGTGLSYGRDRSGSQSAPGFINSQNRATLSGVRVVESHEMGDTKFETIRQVKGVVHPDDDRELHLYNHPHGTVFDIKQESV
ncbi:hypothetical protein VKT23_001212 [Stygiomarasmius scandens]|uniref:DUF6534 domain-containing protein n=1 Tax=Marasmiellus scandens TaxID=2682957 RepID=A0ABR1K6F8_9AGAR